MFEHGLTLLRVRGIPVRLHWSLLLFLPYVAFVTTRQFGMISASLGVERAELVLPPWVWGALLAVGLFVSIVIHELAHSLVAVRNGARVRSITLMMLGGVSMIEGELPPGKEAWMAFAGPLASFGIAGVSWAVYRFAPLPEEVLAALVAFAGTNALLGVFNLLPAFPMDGGRVLRGLLSRSLGKERATAAAARVGQGMAALFALLAVWTFNPVLLLIAWFVYAGASAEKARLSLFSALSGMTVHDFMSDRLGEAWSDETVGAVLRRLLRSGLSGATVMEHVDDRARMAGVVTADDLEGAAERGGAGAPVTAAMDQAPRVVHPEEDVTRALGALSSGETHAVVVVDAQDHVIGLVTPADLRRAAVLGKLAERRPA
jgi:Zn-dependent protease